MPEPILQLRVGLLHIAPPIWRRLQVPGEYSFWDLHVAIQSAVCPVHPKDDDARRRCQGRGGHETNSGLHWSLSTARGVIGCRSSFVAGTARP